MDSCDQSNELRRIWDSHSDGYKDYYFLRCAAVQSGMFVDVSNGRTTSIFSIKRYSKQANEQEASCGNIDHIMFIPNFNKNRLTVLEYNIHFVNMENL